MSGSDDPTRAHLVAVAKAAVNLLYCMGKPPARSIHWDTWNQVDGLADYVREAPITGTPEEISAALRELERVARVAREALEQ